MEDNYKNYLHATVEDLVFIPAIFFSKTWELEGEREVVFLSGPDEDEVGALIKEANGEVTQTRLQYETIVRTTLPS